MVCQSLTPLISVLSGLNFRKFREEGILKSWCLELFRPLKLNSVFFNAIISTFSFYKRSWFSKYLSKQFFQQQWKFQNSPKFLFVWWHVWIKLRHLTGRFSNRIFIHLKIKLKTNFSFNELKHLMDPSGFYFDKRTNYLPNLSSVEKTIGQRDFQAAGSNDHQPMMAIYQK